MKSVFILFIILCAVHTVKAQEKASQYFGIRPYFTVEAYYEKGEFDINVFPLVYQNNISRLMSFRLASIFNYGIREEAMSITKVGLQAAFPFYLKKRKLKSDRGIGIYLAPVFSITRNIEEKHTNAGIYLEPGYHLVISNTFSIQLGLEFGSTYIVYDDERTNAWNNHFGLSIILAWSLI